MSAFPPVSPVPMASDLEEPGNEKLPVHRRAAKPRRTPFPIACGSRRPIGSGLIEGPTSAAAKGVFVEGVLRINLPDRVEHRRLLMELGVVSAIQNVVP